MSAICLRLMPICAAYYACFVDCGWCHSFKKQGKACVFVYGCVKV
jgi:hypothetical protein